MDGALGSRTAWLHQPYSDDTTKIGVQTFDAEELLNLFVNSSNYGWQINTHAIGDKANSVVLDAIEAARAASMASSTTELALSPMAWVLICQP